MSDSNDSLFNDINKQNQPQLEKSINDDKEAIDIYKQPSHHSRDEESHSSLGSIRDNVGELVVSSNPLEFRSDDTSFQFDENSANKRPNLSSKNESQEAFPFRLLVGRPTFDENKKASEASPGPDPEVFKNKNLEMSPKQFLETSPKLPPGLLQNNLVYPFPGQNKDEQGPEEHKDAKSLIKNKLRAESTPFVRPEEQKVEEKVEHQSPSAENLENQKEKNEITNEEKVQKAYMSIKSKRQIEEDKKKKLESNPPEEEKSETRATNKSSSPTTEEKGNTSTIEPKGTSQLTKKPEHNKNDNTSRPDRKHQHLPEGQHKIKDQSKDHNRHERSEYDKERDKNKFNDKSNIKQDKGQRRDSTRKDNHASVTSEEHKSLEKKKESLTNQDDTVEGIDKLGKGKRNTKASRIKNAFKNLEEFEPEHSETSDEEEELDKEQDPPEIPRGEKEGRHTSTDIQPGANDSGSKSTNDISYSGNQKEDIKDTSINHGERRGEPEEKKEKRGRKGKDTNDVDQSQVTNQSSLDIQTDVDPTGSILEEKKEELDEKSSLKNQDKSISEQIHTDKSTSIKENQKDPPDEDDDEEDGDNGDPEEDDNEQSELDISKATGSKETTKSKSKAAKNKKKKQARKKNKKAAAAAVKVPEEEKSSEGLSQQDSSMNRGSENNSYKESIQERAQESKSISTKKELVVVEVENKVLVDEESQYFTPSDEDNYMDSMIMSMSVYSSASSEM